jgi:hypothetical protein
VEQWRRTLASDVPGRTLKSSSLPCRDANVQKKDNWQSWPCVIASEFVSGRTGLWWLPPYLIIDSADVKCTAVFDGTGHWTLVAVRQPDCSQIARLQAGKVSLQQIAGRLQADC